MTIVDEGNFVAEMGKIRGFEKIGDMLSEIGGVGLGF